MARNALLTSKHGETARSESTRFRRLVVVLVDRGTTDAGGARVLLDGGLSPPAERREVWLGIRQTRAGSPPCATYR